MFFSLSSAEHKIPTIIIVLSHIFSHRPFLINNSCINKGQTVFYMIICPFEKTIPNYRGTFGACSVWLKYEQTGFCVTFPSSL